MLFAVEVGLLFEVVVSQEPRESQVFEAMASLAFEAMASLASWVFEAMASWVFEARAYVVSTSLGTS